jgi:hypothetical protein
MFKTTRMALEALESRAILVVAHSRKPENSVDESVHTPPIKLKTSSLPCFIMIGRIQNGVGTPWRFLRGEKFLTKWM